MFDTIAKTIGGPSGLPERAARITVLTKVLEGKFYDKLLHEFEKEEDSAGEYIPLQHRKPSVRYNLCRMVVEDSVAMLFGEDRFPVVHSDDENTRERLSDIFDESNFSENMIDAAMRGSVGSVAILMRVLGGRVFWQPMSTICLTPEWNPEEPDKLLRVTERYQVRGEVLRGLGYLISDDDVSVSFWFQRIWDSNAETWFSPLKVEDLNNGKKFEPDAERSAQHDLGFCPVYWVRNLPGGDEIDGACTFEAAIETQIEIEYRLSQGGRALKYASDPLMMIKDPARGDGGDMVRSASNAIMVGENGDAKMLEIDGASTTAVIEFCRVLREMAIEAIHGNRTSPEKLAAAQSGRAMELLHQSLINLTDRLRHSYGRAVLGLAQMVIAANAKIELTAHGEKIARGSLKRQRLKLQWGPYFAATIHDEQMMTETLGSLKRNGLISRETAVERVADFEDIPDVQEEVKRILADQALEDKRLAAQPGVGVKAGFSEEV